MKKVLIINPYYYPGYRSGGPQQTFMNIVEAYGNEYEFYILTLDHDLGCTEKYAQIKVGWNPVGKAKVQYLSDNNMTAKKIADVAKGMDVVYAGGLFEKTTRLAIKAYKKKQIHSSFWVAPMGVFSDGAFHQKQWKKELFIWMGKTLHLFNGVHWSFTSEMELVDFQKHMKKPELYEIASDIPRALTEYKIAHIDKESEKLKIVFLSRISPKKNLIYAVEIVSGLRGDILFDIYGPKEDLDYWSECKKRLCNLPNNVEWEYKGEIESSQTVQVFSKYDVFLFPTKGENFGHVIYESLAAGCIPVISDTTPWKNFDKSKCGRIISLHDIEEFQIALQNFVEMQNSEFKIWRENAIKEAKKIYKESVDCGGYRKIFSMM